MAAVPPYETAPLAAYRSEIETFAELLSPEVTVDLLITRRLGDVLTGELSG